MDAPSGLARKAQQAFGAVHRRFCRARFRVGSPVALACARLAFAQQVFVLGVYRDAPAPMGEHRAHAFVVLNEKVSRGCAHENFDAGDAGQHFKLCKLARITVGRADIERMIAEHAVVIDLAGGAGQLVLDRLLRNRQRRGVRHFEHGGDAAEHGGARAGMKVFLVDGPRLAEMHLAVDHAGQNVEPRAIDYFCGVRRAERADGGDAAAPYADIARAIAIVIDDDAVLQNEIKRGHGPGSSAPRRSGAIVARQIRRLGAAARAAYIRAHDQRRHAA